MVSEAPVRLAVMGAGLIGRRHIEHILAAPSAALHSIIDPSPEARALAAERGWRWQAGFDGSGPDQPDGVIVATPNAMHVAHGLAVIEAGIPVLVEKPLADTVSGAEELVAAAKKAGVPLAVGHHRRHNPIITRARAKIAAGELGALVAVHGFFWIAKPDDYFDLRWRREPGAGPILVNLIHEVDLIRHLCGEITEVWAIAANEQRGFAVEDSAAVMMRFAQGALGTFTLSDAIPSPWSWELTSAENPAYPATGEAYLMIGGRDASLSLPRLEIWRHKPKQGWWQPMVGERESLPPVDPLRAQIEQFCRVIRNGEPPLVPGREGLESLRVIEAIRQAAATGQSVRLA
ncbi:MAG: Gfo/Idh/MocA family oxidoreductase [Methylobacterium sp.]|nr:Gfo/Idh/MocA family oxidoreductase [Methylobacterium sp.]MCA3627166.1 Gfo/Idh/MocA family oxidoreductase [Methylobacterium sp.]